MTTADPRYVAARKVLLDALFALAPHGRDVIVAGAQAIYLHTGANDIGIAPYTTDGDIALDPIVLGDTPELEATMRAAGFEILPQPEGQPGIWTVTLDIEGVKTIVPVDLIVPDAVAPPGGRRSARIAPHGRQSARKAVGLEAAIVDHSPMTIAALDPDDDRSIIVEVAGLAAMLVAKAHKISDRLKANSTDRLSDKDAADVYRIMQTVSAPDLGDTLRRLRGDPIAGTVTTEALDLLREQFGVRNGAAIAMAQRSLALAIDPDEIVAVSVAFMAALLDAAT
ncbi:MAG: hypothetical protein M0T79_14350 [Actinomycetota bacterium]|nr:hypothetical protein [Actinomycetota bacterium]MDA8354980.1 hypothetical protein [Actinomycetota bacterium]